MKKSTLFIPAILCGMALIAETPVTAKTVPMTREWKNPENGMYSIKRTAEMGGTASLNTTAAVKPQTFYRIDWEARGNTTANGGQISFLIKVGTAIFPGFEVAKEWNPYSFYLYSGNSSSLDFNIYLTKNSDQALDVRNIKFTELSREDYEKGFSMDFEKDNTIPSFWVRSWGQKKFAATIEKSDFINGDKSMKLVSDGTTETSVSSWVFPMIPEAKYKVSFWAKGSANGGVLFVFSAYNNRLSGNHAPNNIIRTDCAVEKEWKEFSFEITYPVDLKKYPAAAIPMANIALFTKVPEVWFDNFKIELVK